MRRTLIIGAIGAGVAGTASGAQWTITPSLGVQETFTDNLAYSEINKRADAITQLIPGLDVLAEGVHTNLQFSYRPILSAYIATPGEDRIDQNLFGSGVVSLVQDRFDVAVQTYANENAGNGNYFTPTISGGLVPNDNRVLDFGGSIAPHYQQRFGDVATLDAYYRVTSTNTSQQSGRSPGGSRFDEFSNNELGREAQVVLGSGDSFGRMISRINFDHADGSGSGINTDYQNDDDYFYTEYHINFEYSVNAQIGYQRIHYDRSAFSLGYNNEGLAWSVGFKIAPNDTTNLAVNYGKREGSYDANVQFNYALAERTLITASYVVAVENQLQTAFNTLPFLGHDQFGNPIDIRTGLPYNTANQPFGQQNTLFRDKFANFTVTRQFVRSSLSLTAYDEVRVPLDGTANNDESWGMRLTYSREMTPVLNGSIAVGYDNHQFGGSALLAAFSQSTRYLNTEATLTYNINDTLRAYADYSYFRRLSTAINDSPVGNQLTIGIRKTF